MKIEQNFKIGQTFKSLKFWPSQQSPRNTCTRAAVRARAAHQTPAAPFTCRYSYFHGNLSRDHQPRHQILKPGVRYACELVSRHPPPSILSLNLQLCSVSSWSVRFLWSGVLIVWSFSNVPCSKCHVPSSLFHNL